MSRRRWIGGSVAGLICLVTAACGASTRPATDVSAPSTPTASTTSTSPMLAETDIVAAGAKPLSVKGDWLSAGEGAVWLSDSTKIRRLDPESGKTIATISVPEIPCEASDVGLSSLWTATCGRPGLARIDPKTNRVSAHRSLDIPADLQGEASIGVGAGAVWLVVDGSDCTQCRVARVEPRRMRVTTAIPVESGAVGVRFGAGQVWITNPEHNLLEQIDPARQKVVRATKVGPGPRFLAVGEGAVWTLNQMDGSITRLDVKTGKTDTIATTLTGNGGDITTGGGWIWARGSPQLLARIDPRTSQVVELYGPSSGSGAVIVGFGAVWISAHDVSTVWRLPLQALSR